MEWLPGEERYLEKLRHIVREMYSEYKELHVYSRTIHRRIRLPAIVISSLGGVASFGTTTFPTTIQKYVSIAVGATSILIALLNTIEGFLKLEERASGSLTATRSLEKLCDDIECEISLPVRDRQTTGAVFVRDCYMRFQQILDSAPTLDHTRTLKHDISAASRRTTEIDDPDEDLGAYRLTSVFARPKSIYQKSNDLVHQMMGRLRSRDSAAILTRPLDPSAPVLASQWDLPLPRPASRTLQSMLSGSNDSGTSSLAGNSRRRIQFRPTAIEQIPESEAEHEHEPPSEPQPEVERVLMPKTGESDSEYFDADDFGKIDAVVDRARPKPPPL